MKIKSKVTLGVLFLFTAILAISGLGLYYLDKLSSDTDNIIKDNYESLQYSKRILGAMEGNRVISPDSVEVNLKLQEGNITEPGELEATVALRVAFERVKESPGDSVAFSELRKSALAIQELNMKAIMYKNSIAQSTAREASTYVVIIVSVFVIIAFTFIINFPGYVANPIVQLTASIKSIANRNYEERLHFNRKDEFEELAKAFNQMAEKMDEYEHSNLAKLLFEKKRIETIINRMTDPVIGLDEKKKIVFINDQALSLLSLSMDRVIDQYAPDVAVDNDLLRTLIQNDHDGKEGDRVIKIVVGGKENYFSRENIAIRYTPTGEEKDKSIGQIILLKNITPYKELDLAKTNFIATISHELKTPIASIQMCAKLLTDKRVGDLNEEQSGIIRTLTDETARLSKITHELLDLSQVETGKLKLDLQKTDPKDIIDQAVEAVKFQAERKHVRIEVKESAAVPSVQADAEKTTWVLVNLLTNAIRYSLENDRIILAYSQENGTVKFSVEDFGPGIEKEYLGKLFDKFYKVPHSRSGTGLGLAISKEFIEAQGGAISVESEIGKGSIFSFKLKNY